MQHHTDILLHAIPGFAILIIAEIIFLAREHRFNKQSKDLPVSTIIGLGFITISFFSKGIILLVYEFVYAHRIYTLPVNGVFIWVTFFFADDFTYYWFHRLSHQIRILWASHSVHHSAEIYSYSSAGLRQTWTGNITGTFLFWIWMPFIGLEPGMVILIKSFSLVYQFCVHTEAIKKMATWFEFIFNTPSHHRVHHGSNLIYLDKNYGAVLIIWDRLFGTFQKEKFTPAYGLTKKIKSSNPFTIVFYEWVNMFKDIKKSKRSKDYWKYVFNAPGWSKDGSTKTTKQLQTNALINIAQIDECLLKQNSAENKVTHIQ
jgi:sterol desaturase/sphingolipid hydroxylase (fatty acid hydroxylase superfamily)